MELMKLHLHSLSLHQFLPKPKRGPSPVLPGVYVLEAPFWAGGDDEKKQFRKITCF